MRWLGTAARSAQPAQSVSATTRVPAAGPAPSAARRSTTPAMSWPGRQPSGRLWNSRNSPRFSENAWTATSASFAAGSGSGTSRIATGAAPFGVVDDREHLTCSSLLVMTGLDPAIHQLHEIPGSSPGMTLIGPQRSINVSSAAGR